MGKGRLAYLETALSKQGFAVQLISSDENVPYAHLNVNLGKDDKGRERTLVIRADSFPLPKEVKNSEQAEETLDEQVFLHLFAAFPFQLKEEAVGELSRLLMYFNKPLEIPGFGIDEVNKLVFYRYSLITVGGMIKKRPLIAIIGTIMLLMDALTPQIEAVAQGAPMVSVLRDTILALSGQQKAA